MANVKINLTEKCLNCPNLDVKDDIDHLYYGNNVYMAFGQITCGHMNVCKLVKDQPTINSLLNEAEE